MKLYQHPVSSYCRKVLLALYEKEIPFENRVLNLRDKIQMGPFREIYPLGKIPCLVLENGEVIPESSIIVEYLDRRFEKGPKLIPEDPAAAQKTRLYDRLCDWYFMEPLGLLFWEGRKPEGERDLKRMAQSRKTAEAMCGFLEKGLEGKEYLVENRFTLAEIAALVALYYLERIGFSLAEWPRMRGWFEKINARPAWQKILEESEPYLKALESSRP